jgi:hypothetical protein
VLCRYVERNALRANLVQRAEDWRWGSLHRWKYGSTKDRTLLAAWPMPRLGETRQRRVNGSGSRGRAAECPTGESVRRPVLVRRHGPPPGAGKHASPSRPTEKEQKRFLTPFTRLSTTRVTGSPPDDATIQFRPDRRLRCMRWFVGHARPHDDRSRETCI